MFYVKVQSLIIFVHLQLSSAASAKFIEMTPPLEKDFACQLVEAGSKPVAVRLTVPGESRSLNDQICEALASFSSPVSENTASTTESKTEESSGIWNGRCSCAFLFHLYMSTF